MDFLRGQYGDAEKLEEKRAAVEALQRPFFVSESKGRAKVADAGNVSREF
jgi:hypothetical protein